ncbi:MAG: DUF4402 domain-containing protein [Acidobacteria bacterium]|nr:DUF4402 domain-containing protein [Acidobacteriota bacterium]
MKQSFNRTLLGALALTLIIPAVGMAQSSDTAQADALANIIAPITLTAGTPLNFGDIVASTATGDVTVTTAGAGSASGGVTLLGTTATTAATFTVGGTAGRGFTVVVDPSVTMGSMTATLNANIASGVVGTDNVAVGGVLTVGANQAEGLYTGTFDVTVSYQ